MQRKRNCWKSVFSIIYNIFHSGLRLAVVLVSYCTVRTCIISDLCGKYHSTTIPDLAIFTSENLSNAKVCRLSPLTGNTFCWSFSSCSKQQQQQQPLNLAKLSCSFWTDAFCVSKLYTVSQKRKPPNFCQNFLKSQPIFKILSLLDRGWIFPTKLRNIFHHTVITLLHYLGNVNSSNLLQILKKKQRRKFDC